MTSQLHALYFDARDPALLADFWARFLGWDVADDPGHGVELVPTDDTGFRLGFRPSDRPKVDQNSMHLDLTSTSLDDQRQTVARALELGARHLDIGQGPDASNIVLADPEGNELDVIEPGNSFLADCGSVGAVASDGSQAVGYFWSQALGWPLVWDQDEETAIRSPHGGPKITWGGPPLDSDPATSRAHYDLVVAAGEDLGTEVERLLGLGATRVAGGDDETGRVVLADPDGRAFCLRGPT